MAAILVPGSFLLIYLSLSKYLKTDWRKTLLVSAVLFGALLAVTTEILSLFNALNFLLLASSWGVISFALVLALIKNGPFLNRNNILPNVTALSHQDILLIAPTILIVIWLAILAWSAPPNTWDSMTYHMSRVMHWIQNQNIGFYPTHQLRQLHLTPWSEYAILHLQLLSGGDRFANFVQWTSMIGSLIGVSLIARELGANLRGQILAVLMCATIPMGIMQGTSTQTDYVCSFWLVTFAYFVIHYKNNTDLTSQFGAGLALGLGILTKATAYIFAFPFSLWFLYLLIKNYRKKNWPLLVAPFVIALTLNMGHYIRNYELHGSPIGTLQEEGGFKYVNEHINISTTIGNLLKNTGLHLATPIEQINLFIGDLISNTANTIQGVTNEEITSINPGNQYYIPRISISEDSTGNLLHVFIILTSIYIYLFKRIKNKVTTYYLICWLSGFLLFSAILNWQPWGSRLQLPFFVLAAPFIGIMFTDISYTKNKQTNYVRIIIAILYLSSLPLMLMSITKPVFRHDLNLFRESRIEQYFAANQAISNTYVQTTDFLKKQKCSNVGVIVEKGHEFYEYPFWILMQDSPQKELFTVQNLNVTNHSNIFLANTNTTQVPCAIVSIGSNVSPTLNVKNQDFAQSGIFENLSVYTNEQLAH